jgi:hypothetical protein
LSLKVRKYQTGAPDVGRYLSVDKSGYIRHAWPYDGGGAYETFAAGGMGH